MQIKNFLAIACFAAASVSQAQSEEVKIPTRFGEMKTNKNGDLQFKGKTITPTVNLVSSAYVIATYKLATSDVVLVSQAAGNTCPGQFAYITVTTEVARATPAFGTCYDDGVKPVQNGEALTFTMKNIGNKGSSKYTYEKGVVTENGKPLK